MTVSIRRFRWLARIFLVCFVSFANLIASDAYAQKDSPITQADMQPTIVGGSAAAPHMWPWQAMLLRNGRFRCGASLIDTQWVLTAAHCLYDAANVIHAYELSIVLGEYNLVTASPSRQTVQVERLSIHPGYTGICCQQDLAVLKLARSVTPTNAIAVVPLLAENLNAQQLTPEVHTRGIATGWGLLGAGGTQPMLLQQVELTVTYHFTADGYFIANGIGTQGICFGDSGGPFVVRIGNDWHLAGVSSFGGCKPGGGFARVTESTTATWIKRQLHPIDTFPIMDLPVRMYVPLVSR